jgi:hypothetical protein
MVFKMFKVFKIEENKKIIISISKGKGMDMYELL